MYTYILHLERYFCESRNIMQKIPTRCCIWSIDRHRSIILRAHITSIVLRWQIYVLYWTRVDMRRMAWISDIQLLIGRGKTGGGEGIEPWKIVARSSSSAFDEPRVSGIDARTRGTNGRMGRNLIKKKEGKVYYNFKGLANGVECPIVGRPTRNHRTQVRMVEYLVRDARIKKEEMKRKEWQRIAGKKVKEEDFGTTVISGVHGTPAIVSAILNVFSFPPRSFYLAFNPTVERRYSSTGEPRADIRN